MNSPGLDAARGDPLGTGAVILPIVAILSATSERSRRSGLATFTLGSHRDRVIGAKLVAAVAVGLASTAVAFTVGAPRAVGPALTLRSEAS